MVYVSLCSLFVSSLVGYHLVLELVSCATSWSGICVRMFVFPPGAGKNRAKLRNDIEEYHIAYAIDFDDSDIDTFIARRPDGLAFDKEKNYVYSWNTQEPWTQMKTGQRRRSREKTTDTAPI